MVLYPFLGTLHDPDPNGLSRGVDGNFATFVVNTTVETVLWTSGVLPDVDFVLDSYFHTHREMIDDVWFFRASPSQLGLLDATYVSAFAAYLQEPCPGSPPISANPSWSNASAAARAEACVVASELAGKARDAGRESNNAGLIDRTKRHIDAHVRAAGGSVIPVCRYSEFQQRYSLADPRAAGGKVVCPFTQPVSGDTRWVGVAFLRAQRRGLPTQYSMHCAVRVFHSTRSDMSDDDPSWRDMRPCDFRTVSWWRRSLGGNGNRQFDRACGEETYFPLDVWTLITSPLHPHLLLNLLSIATEARIKWLVRHIGGPIGGWLLDALPFVVLKCAAAFAALVAILCCCWGCCCRRSLCSRLPGRCASLYSFALRRGRQLEHEKQRRVATRLVEQESLVPDSL